MAEYKDYISNIEEEGSINISEDVIASIAAVAISEVEGVSGLSVPVTKDITEIIGGKKNPKGVRIQLTDDVINIDVYIKVNYGVKIQETAECLQKMIESSITSITSMEVGKINVFVVGVDFEQVQTGEKAVEDIVV